MPRWRLIREKMFSTQLLRGQLTAVENHESAARASHRIQVDHGVNERPDKRHGATGGIATPWIGVALMPLDMRVTKSATHDR